MSRSVAGDYLDWKGRLGPRTVALIVAAAIGVLPMGWGVSKAVQAVAPAAPTIVDERRFDDFRGEVIKRLDNIQEQIAGFAALHHDLDKRVIVLETKGGGDGERHQAGQPQL